MAREDTPAGGTEIGPAPAPYEKPHAEDIDTKLGPTEAAALVANSGQRPPP